MPGGRNMTLRAIFWRSILLTGLWWILTEGQLDSWNVGLVSVVLALIASLVLLPPSLPRFSLAGLISFLVYFLGQSLKGGVQVALMALRPDLDLHPDVQIIYPRLPEGVGRVILVNTLSLLPGTLSVSLTTNTLRLHILDERRPIEVEVRNAEARIAHMLGLKLEKL